MRLTDVISVFVRPPPKQEERDVARPAPRPTVRVPNVVELRGLLSRVNPGLLAAFDFLAGSSGRGQQIAMLKRFLGVGPVEMPMVQESSRLDVGGRRGQVAARARAAFQAYRRGSRLAR
jgi:hypothetical protein